MARIDDRASTDAVIFREDRGWQVAWPAALCFATLFHGFAFAIAEAQDVRVKAPPITMAILRPAPPKIEAPPEPPPPEQPKPKPLPKPVEHVVEAPQPLPKVADLPPTPIVEEVPLAVMPVTLGPQTGEGVAVPLGSQDGTAGERPVSGTSDVVPTTNVVSKSALSTFNSRGYRDAAIALVNKQKRYPRKARVLGLEGKCWIKVLLERDGSIVGTPTFVGKCTGHDVLDEEAIRMVRAAAPFPALPTEVAVPYPQVFPISFSLGDAAAQ